MHTDSSYMVLDRLITLIKKDVKSQQYTESFLKKILAMSIDVVIYVEGFKIKNISKVCFEKDVKFVTVFNK